jgi:hypothetical protein
MHKAPAAHSDWQESSAGYMGGTRCPAAQCSTVYVESNVVSQRLTVRPRRKPPAYGAVYWRFTAAYGAGAQAYGAGAPGA